jgi:ribosome-interacting GTPase 1
MMREYGVINADVIVRSDVTQDQLVDFLSGNRIYVPAFIILNKIDLVSKEYLQEVKDMMKNYTVLPISAEKGLGIEKMKLKIFESLKLIRIYMRPQRGSTDYDEPLVIRSGSTVGDICDIIHRGFKDRFRYANIWGNSAKFPGQTVGQRHVLVDEDVLTIVVSK